LNYYFVGNKPYRKEKGGKVVDMFSELEDKISLLRYAGNEQREQLQNAAKRIATLENKLMYEKKKNDRNFMERLIYLFTGV
jgi:hypothetical protein